MDLRDGIKQINFKSQALFFFLQKNFSVLMFYIFFLGKKLYVNCLESKTIFFFSQLQIHIKIHKMPHNSRIDVEFYGGKYLPLTTSYRNKKTNKINLNT